jgi:hypothetical protein
LLTTNTLDNAIARPAHIGFINPSAASGIAAALYANAQNTLALIVRSVARESKIASVTRR